MLLEIDWALNPRLMATMKIRLKLKIIGNLKRFFLSFLFSRRRHSVNLCFRSASNNIAVFINIYFFRCHPKWNEQEKLFVLTNRFLPSFIKKRKKKSTTRYATISNKSVIDSNITTQNPEFYCQQKESIKELFLDHDFYNGSELFTISLS